MTTDQHVVDLLATALLDGHDVTVVTHDGVVVVGRVISLAGQRVWLVVGERLTGGRDVFIHLRKIHSVSIQQTLPAEGMDG